MLFNETKSVVNSFIYNKSGIATFVGKDESFTNKKEYKVTEFYNELISNKYDVKFFIVENDNGEKEIINQNKFNKVRERCL